jgi:hypothetical protein
MTTNTFATKTAREIKLKDGGVIPKGVFCDLSFGDKPTTIFCKLENNERIYKLRASRAGDYFVGIEMPDIETLEEWSNDGICESVFGERVEPDGWDADGSPSWLLVLGYI